MCPAPASLANSGGTFSGRRIISTSCGRASRSTAERAEQAPIPCAVVGLRPGPAGARRTAGESVGYGATHC